MANMVLKALTPIIMGMADKIYVTVCNQITDKFKIEVNPKFTELGTKMNDLEKRLDVMLTKINPLQKTGGEPGGESNENTNIAVASGGSKKIIKTRKSNNRKSNNRKSKKRN